MSNHPLRFAQALWVDRSSGLPPVLETVGQSLIAIESLSRSVKDRVHWRFAAALLKLVSTGETDDVPLARQALTAALTADGGGWRRTDLPCATVLKASGRFFAHLKPICG